MKATWDDSNEEESRVIMTKRTKKYEVILESLSYDELFKVFEGMQLNLEKLVQSMLCFKRHMASINKNRMKFLS